MRWAILLWLIPLMLIIAGCSRGPVIQATPELDTVIKLPATRGVGTRPRVAVIADNAGTETTDFIVPYAVLKESGVADVVSLSTRAGVVDLHPALRIHADQTLAEFDAAYPEGADIVIVPAMHDPENSVVLEWLRKQARNGALIVGVCDGVILLAHAGLLEGKRATAHWYSIEKLAGRFPESRWIRGRRYIADDGVLTTTGVTASLPVSLALLEAIAGRARAVEVANRLGITDYSPAHEAEAFSFTWRHLLTAGFNWSRFWSREQILLPVADGVDEIALALRADAWSRTFRSRAIAVAENDGRIRSRNGLLIETERPERKRTYTPEAFDAPPASALDHALAGIAARYGEITADFVTMQLEYPQGEH